MNAPIKGLSSMATRALLAELAADWARTGGRPVEIESVGGVVAAGRVQAGEALDVVWLASDAIDALAAAGRLRAGSRVDLAHSPVAVAVREGAARPDIGGEDAVRQAVRAARSLSFSTGPSGAFLARLFAAWGIADEIAARIVQAPPGVPVGALVADGRAELGFQQLSELQGLPGITVLGTLPPAIAHITTFAAGVPAACSQPQDVAELLAFMNAPAAAAAKRRHGMTPA